MFRDGVRRAAQFEIRQWWRHLVEVDVYASERVGTGSKWSNRAKE
jgi:hypothetical protein